MKKNYLLRLDDACPTMDAGKWQQMEDLLDRYHIRPIVGIIPHNEDKKQMIYAEDPLFWQKTQVWQRKGWGIAMHGYNHVYISKEAGDINPMWRKSEFAGVDLFIQCEKIKNGLAILEEKGLNPICFFAPSHTFDENTIIALENNSKIRIISDTIALKPYAHHNFLYIPQISGHCLNIPCSGTYTFCYHPNMMDEIQFHKLEMFLSQHAVSFVSLDDIKGLKYNNRSFIDRLVSYLFFTQRRLRGLI